MKKLLIIGFVVAFGLVLLGAGCGTQAPSANTNTGAVNEAPSENVNAINPGVSADELNQLQSNVNSLQYDDLNTFSQ